MNLKKLDEKRELLRMSKAELCRQVGITESGYWRLLKGYRKPRFETIIKLCKVLNVNIEELTD